MPTPIGLHGLAGAGKDATFGFIREWADERGVSARRRSFADALKLSFTRMFIPDCSVDEAVMWCNEIKFTGALSIEWGSTGDHGTHTTVKHTVSGRTALQRFGTEGHRNVFGDNFWVDVLFPLTNDAVSLEPIYPLNFTGPLDQQVPEICVAADLRFENEGQRVKDLGGFVLEIVRPTSNGGLVLTESEMAHASETGFPHVDATIINGGDLDLLRVLVHEWCEEHLAPIYPPATFFDT